MFSRFVDNIFDYNVTGKLPVVNIIIWSFTFLKPSLTTAAEILDFLLCTGNGDCGIKLI